MTKWWLALASLALTNSALAGGGITNVTVDGNAITAEIALPGDIAADITISFENAIGLSEVAVGLSAELINVSDPQILNRFPVTDVISIPDAFPVLIRIQPPATSGLTFTGMASVDLHTHNLPYSAHTPLRLFVASAGGSFSDYTANMSSGSYRVRGNRGDFSEFLIVTDLRPISSTISQKFNRLSAMLNNHAAAIAPALYDELSLSYDAALAAWQSGDAAGASDEIADFDRSVRTASGDDMPNVWRSSRDLDNVSGLLRAEAATLKLSLLRAANGLP